MQDDIPQRRRAIPPRSKETGLPSLFSVNVLMLPHAYIAGICVNSLSVLTCHVMYDSFYSDQKGSVHAPQSQSPPGSQWS